ncbi:hypothetical protein [Nocardia wallacei]|uniref:hypothetical protein n=1 Tax=Nocardia wallacei TaxID=480035 RepID=UPI002453A9F8|nr:hypothetical protein [Nocardia wallacei]
MSTFDDLASDELVLDAEPLAEEMVRKAQRVAASYAADAEECRELLAMLGIDGTDGRTRCSGCGGPVTNRSPDGYRRTAANGLCADCRRREKDRAKQHACACGRYITPGAAECRQCRQARLTVPMQQVRTAVERIQRATGMSRKDIAGRIGLNPSSLVSALAPSKTSKRVQTSTYEAVQRLAEELGA